MFEKAVACRWMFRLLSSVWLSFSWLCGSPSVTFWLPSHLCLYAVPCFTGHTSTSGLCCWPFPWTQGSPSAEGSQLSFTNSWVFLVMRSLCPCCSNSLQEVSWSNSLLLCSHSWVFPMLRGSQTQPRGINSDFELNSAKWPLPAPGAAPRRGVLRALKR